MKKSYLVVILTAVLVALLIGLPQALAYEKWSNAVNDQGQCASCHGAFREGTYFSVAEGISWGDDLHAVHLGSTDVESAPNGTCDSCHGGTGTSGREVNLRSSADANDGVNAISCMGCHGRLEDANNLNLFGPGWGAGLRQHHDNSSDPMAGPGTCGTCHSDNAPASFTPAPESTMPPWYASVTHSNIMMTMNPCSADGQEDFSSNGTGLDNDGDQAYDGLDSDCASVTPTPGDFDFDGMADILWRNNSTGHNWLYRMNGSSISASEPINIVSGSAWQIAGTGDYNGDGKADILWRNSSTGQNWMYLMSGAGISSSASVNIVSDLDWQIVGSGDYNGDTKADILWRNSVTGQNWIYFMNGSSVDSSVALNEVSDLSWQIVGNGDYNGDGNSDILWFHTGSGTTWIYLMDGASIINSLRFIQVADLQWQIEGSGDYDDDGDSDILWHHRGNGAVWMHQFDGATLTTDVGQVTGSTGSSVTVTSTDWTIVGEGDYNGDGSADILWRNGTSGQNWLYLMNGVSINSSTGINSVPTVNWEIVDVD